MSIKICINLYFNNELRFRIAVGLIQNVYDKPKQKLAHQPQTKMVICEVQEAPTLTNFLHLNHNFSDHYVN